jgi:hypothetical protein
MAAGAAWRRAGGDRSCPDSLSTIRLRSVGPSVARHVSAAAQPSPPERTCIAISAFERVSWAVAAVGALPPLDRSWSHQLRSLSAGLGREEPFRSERTSAIGPSPAPLRRFRRQAVTAPRAPPLPGCPSLPRCPSPPAALAFPRLGTADARPCENAIVEEKAEQQSASRTFAPIRSIHCPCVATKR